MAQSGFDSNDLYQEAQTRWLKPAEVLFILQNHEKYQFTEKAPQRPCSGSLFLFDKKVLKFFRKDGHDWRRKKDGRAVAEAHERLKVGNLEALNCYYAHGEQNPDFRRRIYWMLDPAYEHIVLVHYRDISGVKMLSGHATQISPNSSTYSPNPDSYRSQNPSSNDAVTGSYEIHKDSYSPGSVEVTSDRVIEHNGVDANGEFIGSSKLEVNQALRRLEEQLSLNEDSVNEIDFFSDQNENADNEGFFEHDRYITDQDQIGTIQNRPEITVPDQYYSGYTKPPHSNHLDEDSGNHGKYGHDEWKKLLTSCEASLGLNSKEELTSSIRLPSEIQESFPSKDSGQHNGNFQSPTLLPQKPYSFEAPVYSSEMETCDNSFELHNTSFDQGQIRMPLKPDLSWTAAQRQKFTIQEISPEWGYSSEATKVIIIGSFPCDSSESNWTCMFGDTEVPVQIIQRGVMYCKAPPHLPGKVTLYITSGNHLSCSEVREFEYRDRNSNCAHCNISQPEAFKTPEELLLLVRFAQRLLSGSASVKEEITEPGDLPTKVKADDELWSHVIAGLLDGSGTSFGTVDWLLEELLKDKLLSWLSARSEAGCNQAGCSLSKNEQGIIHLVAGLGFDWALNLVLSHGVSINFRDINGWTALHWAARFGREKMVASLIASGAFAGAVTDPSSQDPTGKTAASIAASCGHKGLAGYLSEVALTSHLSSLKLEESELSKGSALVQAEMTVNSITSDTHHGTHEEDQLSLKDSLAAVRNAAQTASRIQAAFRAYSFRKRQQREARASDMDEYGLYLNDIHGLSAMSKLTFGNARDHNSAALSIQKKYRGWRGRKDYITLRQNVVKIQAHVRGYQVRKHYKVICWAVGIIDKVVLRWRRKGVGLRSFSQESESIDTNEDEDILKEFRRQKVDGATDEAFSRVLSMVKSPDARQQYSRMLDRYNQAKAELGDTSEPSTSISLSDISDMENDDYTDFSRSNIPYL